MCRMHLFLGCNTVRRNIADFQTSIITFYSTKLKAKRIKQNVVGPCIILRKSDPLWKKIWAKKKK